MEAEGQSVIQNKDTGEEDQEGQGVKQHRNLRRLEYVVDQYITSGAGRKVKFLFFLLQGAKAGIL